MKLSTRIAATFFCAGASALGWPAATAAPSSSSSLEVTIDGGVVAGRFDDSLAGRSDVGVGLGRGNVDLAIFQGLRYAAPPVGELRWRAPQPVRPWPGVASAGAAGASCIQRPELSVESGGGDPRPIVEDCLFVNVWTPVSALAAQPGAKDAKLPVMVWIHGGALIFGSGGVPVYDGAALARRGAVVVTLNYRLGALGFFAHPSISPSSRSRPVTSRPSPDQPSSQPSTTPNGDVNFGLLDQIAALQWVQRNIAAFGGDPGNVTIFGQSAGAESVLALFASPLARGLFHRGIAQSPYGIPSHTRAQARAVAGRVAAALKLNGTAASADELRSVPAEAFAALTGRGESLAPTFVVGDRALPQPILATFQRGDEAQVPLIIGNTSDDGSIAVAFGLDPAAIVAKLGAARIALRSLYPEGLTDAQLGRQTVRDLVFTAFARRIAYLHASRSPTWRYYYGYVGEGARGPESRNTGASADVPGAVPAVVPGAVISDPPGVAHGAEVPYTMGTAATCACLGAPATTEDLAAADRVSRRWFDFARTGTPSPGNDRNESAEVGTEHAGDSDTWPRDARRHGTLLEFGQTHAVRRDFMARRLNAFIGVLNVAGLFAPRQ